MNTYTREQLDSMSAGKELDKMVAEKVLGCKCYYPAVFGANTSYPDSTKLIPLPNYSTDISAALEVVEKMRKNKIYLDIRVWPEEYQVLPHQDEHNKLIEHCIVKSPSLPEAICKAALLASLGESGGTGDE